MFSLCTGNIILASARQEYIGLSSAVKYAFLTWQLMHDVFNWNSLMMSYISRLFDLNTRHVTAMYVTETCCDVTEVDLTQPMFTSVSEVLIGVSIADFVKNTGQNSAACSIILSGRILDTVMETRPIPLMPVGCM